jgi:hypothetical protein
LEAAFPNLATDGYEVTSPSSRKYNCISWAAGDVTQKWDCTAVPMAGYYWPPEADVGQGIDALVSAFKTLRYELCDDASRERGFEKIALFADAQGEWTHAAKQLADGRWSSKLGDADDITHTTPHGVEG